ncbi:MAG: protein kinase [Planctomycetes bacterium]|nr:protein kinase [Planctomycetota bacterium]
MRAHQSGNLDFSSLSQPEQRVLRRATALDPSQRYPTTVEMVQDLRKASTSANRPASQGEIYMGGPIQPNQELVPGHKLVRKIGQGGYGEVWEGVAPGGIRCAFKVISNLDGSQNVQEFRVLEMMKGLEHDHLMALQAYWLLDAEGRILPEGPEADSARVTATMLVIQTQLAAKNLAQRLKECQNAGWPGIPSHELLPYVRQAASAIDYLNAPQHQLGDRVLSIQHRDIKPENILLSRQGSVKVSDFGLAKMVEGTSATIHSKSRGLTAAYAAPEMFKGLVTRSTDQYSLAITYYRLRTSKLPFDPNQPLFSMMLVHTEGRLDFGLLSLAEQEVLQRATKVNPDDRWPSCLDMVAALEMALGVRPDTASQFSLALSTSGPPPVVAGEPTRVVATIIPSGDKIPPTMAPSTPVGTAPLPSTLAPQVPAPPILAPQVPEPPAAPVARVVVPATLPPTQNPHVPRPGPAPAPTPATASNLKEQAPDPQGLPPTLPPTLHPSISRPVRSPALQTPPPLAPPLPPSPAPPARGTRDSGSGESKPTQLASIGEFDSSSEHPLLPGAHGETNVTLTRVKQAKSRMVVPLAADLEPVDDVDPAILDEVLRAGEETATDDVVLDAPPEESDKIARARQQRRRLAKIVGGSLAATILGYLLVYILTPGPQETSEQIVLRIHEHMDRGDFARALDETDDANLEDEVKQKLREEGIDRWLARVPELTTENVDKILEQLEEIRGHGGKDHEAFEKRFSAARRQHLLIEAGQLLDKQQFVKAYELLSKPEMSGKQGDELRSRLWTAWVADADQKWGNKDFSAALEAAKAIVERNPSDARAKKIKEKVQAKIAEIQDKVKKHLDDKKFAVAYDYAKQSWPLNRGLRDEVLRAGHDWARQLLDAKKYEEAKKIAEEVRSKEPDHEGAAAVVKEAGQALLCQSVEEQIANGATNDYKGYQEAATTLQDPRQDFKEADRKALLEKLEQVWLGVVRNEPNADKKLKGFDRIIASLGSKKAKDAKQAWIDGAATEDEVASAFRLNNLDPMEFKDCNKRLDELMGRAAGPLRGRVATLQTLVRLAEDSTQDPTSDALNKFFDLAKDTKVSKAGRENLDATYALLLDQRVEKRIATVLDKKGRAKLLQECNKGGNTVGIWALAYRVEGLIEMSRAKEPVSLTELENAQKALQERRPLGQESAYVRFVRALNKWSASENDAPEAAKEMVSVFGAGNIPEELRQPERKELARRVLAAGVKKFRDSGNLEQPFGTADNADAVLRWLQTAERLSDGKLEPKDQTNLALATWYESGNTNRSEAGKLALKALEQEQSPLDVLLLRVLHARSCEKNPVGRLDSYVEALKPAHLLLKGKQGDKVAEYLFTNLLAPALDKQGEFLGTTAEEELRDRFARLCAGLARLLKENVKTWSNLMAPGGKEPLLKSGPVKTAVQLYEQAAKLASKDANKAEYLAYQGFIYNQLPDPDAKELHRLAEEATRLARQYVGAIGLRGIALVREAEPKEDYAEKLKILDEANTALGNALWACANLPPEQRQEWEPLLNRGKAGACLKLAIYVQDPTKQKDYLDQGTASIQKVLDKDKQDLEASETYGLLLEDYEYLNVKTGQYQPACDALEKARDINSKVGGKTSPWLGSGRTRVKWAKAVYKRDAKSPQVDALLAAADDDLGEVTKYSGKTVSAVEAYYWLGEGHSLKDFRGAEEAFKAGVQLAKDLKSRVWEDLCLTGWTEMAYARALDRSNRKALGAEDAIQYAEERAKDLERFNKARATFYEVALLRSRYFPKGEYPPRSEELKLLDGEWLKKGRLQDALWRALLLVDRAETRFGSLGAKPEDDPDALRQVYDDAQLALNLAKQGTIPSVTKGQAHGFVGLACWYAAEAKNVTPAQKQQYIQEAIPELRQGTLLAPKGTTAWLWKLSLASLRVTEKGGTEAEQADRIDEVSRNFEEADRDMPKDPTIRARYSWLPGYRDKINKEALTKLQETVSNEPRAQTAWRWHWRVAELLRDDKKEEALTNAREALKKIPKDAPHHQRQRIEELVKGLE